MAATYQYGSVDIGQDNNDTDDFRSFIQVIRGTSEVANKQVSFPNINVELKQNLGVRGRRSTWLVDMVDKSSTAANLLIFEAAMEALQEAEATYGLLERNITYPRAYIESFDCAGPRVPLQTPWAFGQKYIITYRILK